MIRLAVAQVYNNTSTWEEAAWGSGATLGDSTKFDTACASESLQEEPQYHSPPPIVCLLVTGDRFSLCTPARPGIYYVDQAGQEFVATVLSGLHT